MLDPSLQRPLLVSLTLAFTGAGCGQILGLGDFKEGAGGAGTSTSVTTTAMTTTASSTTGTGGQSQGGGGAGGGTTTSSTGGNGGAACVPVGVEDCNHVGDEDCDGTSCSELLWNDGFGDASDQQVTSTAVDKDGNIVIAGHFTGTLQVGPFKLDSSGSKDYFLVKFSPSGLPLWGHRYGDMTNNGNQVVVAVDGGGNIILTGDIKGIADFGGVCGSVSNQGQLPERMFIAKLGPLGNCIWAKAFGNSMGGNDGQSASSATIGNNGDVIVTGRFGGSIQFGSGVNVPTFSSVAPGYPDVFVANLATADGSHIWSNKIGAAAGHAATYSRGVSDIVANKTGDIFLSGYFGDSISFGQTSLLSQGISIFLTKFDSGGVALWAHKYSGPGGGFESPTALAVDALGQVSMTGYISSNTDFGGGPLIKQGSYDGFVASFDTSGNHQWSMRFGDPNDASGIPDTGSDIATDKDGNVLLTGLLYGVADFGGGVLTNAGGSDVFVAKFDHSGKHLWSKIFGDLNDQTAGGIAADPSTGEVIFAGSSKGAIDFGTGALNSMGGYDVVLAKFQP